MTRERFTFDDLGFIEARLRRLSTDAAYLILQDRTVQGKDTRVGRFDLTEADARPWLAGDDPESEPPEGEADAWEVRTGVDDPDEDDDYGDDAEPDDEGESGDEVPDYEAEIPWRQIKEAAILWVRDTAIRNTAGRSPRRFRLKVMGPKASSVVDSGHFGCRDRTYRPHRSPVREDVEDEAELPSLPAMPAIPPMERMVGMTPVDPMQALGLYYTQFGHLLLGTVGQLQGINNSMVVRLSGDLNRSRDQVEELVGAILESRAAQVEQAHSHALEHTESHAKTALAREAIHNLGDAARAFLAIPDVPGELAGLLKVVGQSPELVRTLSDPSVQSLLADPGNVAMLTGVLRQFAAQAEAMKASGMGAQPTMQTAPPPVDGA